jgi:hypothetical protein
MIPTSMPTELAPYAGRWQIAAYPAGLDVYSAERRESGGALRYIVARTPAELAAKLAAAEQAEQ